MNVNKLSSSDFFFLLAHEKFPWAVWWKMSLPVYVWCRFCGLQTSITAVHNNMSKWPTLSPPSHPKGVRCCFFFFINAACLRECNDGKCNKQDNKCIYSVYAGGVELWFKVVSLFPNCVYALDGLIWNNSFVINNMYRRLGSAREIRKHTSKKFPWKQRFYATTDVFSFS